MYKKQDARMTQGLAIICMLVLHLFCRKGEDVFGTPLIWLNETTPLVYLFGFFSEICVPLFSLSIGYAQELLYESGKATWRDRRKRILKLMMNYWIIVVLFSAVGLIIRNQQIPGSAGDFLRSLILLHSYNGAWWFLHSYVFFLLIPPVISLFPVYKVSNLIRGGAFCSGMIIVWYLLERFNVLSTGEETRPLLRFFIQEIKNLIGILPIVWLGGMMRRFYVFDSIKTMLDEKIPDIKLQKVVLSALILSLFIGVNIIHKAVLCPFVAVFVFIIFNLWSKSYISCRVFSFLGQHSTNIWLTHMFFYIYMFPGLVQKARYPLLMLLFLLALCIVTSYLVMGIQTVINVEK